MSYDYLFKIIFVGDSCVGKTALAERITKNEFHLAYQAKVNSEDKVVGYEALIRWNSESLGFIPPD